MSVPHAIPSGTALVEAESLFPAAAVRLSHLDLIESTKSVLQPERSFRLDLCITPRLPSRMRFDSWVSSRFERPGRLFIVPPNESLTVWNDLGRETVIVCNLFTSAIGDRLDADFPSARQMVDASLNVASEAIEQAMLRMVDEVRNPGFAADMMIEALAMQAAVELQRHYRCPPLPPIAGGLAGWRLRRIDDRLRSSDRPPTLTDLAVLCGLSVRQLSRGFQESRGMAIGRYVAQYRAERAKQLLARDRSVKEIAGQLGFTSAASFCCAFRKATGLTPSSYRRMAPSRQDRDAMS